VLEADPRSPTLAQAPALPPQAGQREAEAPAHGLDAAGAQLAAFAVLAAVNAAAIEILLPMPHGGARFRALHHLFDAGQTVALGLLASSAVEAWRHWGPRRAVWTHLALGGFAAAVAVPLLQSDLTGLAAKLAPGRGTMVALGALLVASGVMVAAAAGAGRALARPWLRWAGVVVGVACMAANHWILENDYPGVHLYAAWSAAMLIGGSLTGLRVRRLVSGRATTSLRAVAALACGAALVVPPSNAIGIELLRLSGAVVAPVLARLRSIDLPGYQRAVWLDRTDAPDVPPSKPSLLPSGPVVVLVAIDALRADVIAKPEYAGALPVLHALKRDSVDFTEARSPATGTIWTLSSLFAGRYYSELYWTVKQGGITRKVYPHEDTSIRFPEILSRGGVQTVLYSEMPDVTNDYGVVRGVGEEQCFKGKSTPSAPTVTNAALERLRAQGAEPLFMYLHFLEPHAPYVTGGSSGTDFERYVREVGVVDREVGRLREALDAKGLADRAVLIVMADHGEAFGEHATRYHSFTVYEEVVRVPLLVHAAGVAPRRVTRPVSLMDLGPTVLDLMGQPTPGSFMGQSFVPYLRDEDPVLWRPIAMDTGRWQQAIVFPDGMKAIHDRRKNTSQLYNLVSDPLELHNLLDEPTPATDERMQQLRAFFEAHRLRRKDYSVPFRP
jgi:hypothetical protein